MQANYQSGTDIPASMTVDGATYDSVGVRFRGQTSYFANNDLSGVAEVSGGLRWMKVFPNPAREEISVEVEEYTGPRRLQIADLLGRVVWTQELSGRETIVPVRQLASGAYFVRVEGIRAELLWIGD